MKDVGRREAVKKRWREYFKHLMNVKNGSPAALTTVILSGGKGGVYKEKSLTYDVIQAIKRLRNGKAAGIDGITAEMLKCGDGVTKWMVMICEVAWRGKWCQQTGQEPSLSQSTRGRARGEEFGSYRGLSLLSIP